MRHAAIGLVLAVTACRPQSVDTRMWNHYQHVATVQNAIIGTNLEVARTAARWVAEHQDSVGMPAAAHPWVDSMRAAAKLVADAPDLGVAAVATAHMGWACGACHLAAGKGPVPGNVGAPPPSGDTAVAPRMTYHMWAIDRLWDGMTTPSDRAWAAGAVAMSDVPRFQSHIRRTGPSPWWADSMAQRLHALGERAPLAPRSDRPAIYGRMLAMCATCHQAYHVQLPEVEVTGY